MAIGSSSGQTYEDAFDFVNQTQANTPTFEPMNVPVIRHGSTSMNSDTSTDRMRGWGDVPLDAEGRQESKKVAQQLKGTKLSYLFHSDLSRAKDTADDISETTGAKLVQMPELRTWHIGELEGMKSDEANPILAQYATRTPDVPLPGGESFNQFKGRVMGGVNKANEIAGGLPFGIVTHHKVERLLNGYVKAGLDNPDVDKQEFLAEGNEPGSIQQLPIGRQTFGKTAHEEYYKASRGQEYQPFQATGSTYPDLGTSSESIEDRRNDPNWRRWFAMYLGDPIMGGSPEEWAKHWGEIKEAFKNSAAAPPTTSSLGKSGENTLARAAGLDDLQADRANHPQTLMSTLKDILNTFNPLRSTTPEESKLTDQDWLLSKAKMGRILDNVKNLSSHRGDISAGDIAMGLGGGPSGGSQALFLGTVGMRRLLGDETANNLTSAVSKALEEADPHVRAGSVKQSQVDEMIRQKTGISFGDDQLVRYEIPDNKSAFDPKILENLRQPGTGWEYLDELYKHPDLYKAYPNLKNVRVSMVPRNEEFGGRYLPDRNEIELVDGYSEKTTRKVLLHEIQHWIQHHEDLSYGGNPGMFAPKGFQEAKERLNNVSARYYKDLESRGIFDAEDFISNPNVTLEDRLNAKKLGEAQKNVSKIEDFMTDQYNRLSGEVESRNVEYRSDFDPETMKEVPPEATESVPRIHQIERKRGQ